MVLNNEGFGCPTITQDEWVSIGQLEFLILDGFKDPHMTFDTVNTNFNVDDPNDGSLTVGKGDFADLNGFILDCPNVNIPPSAFFSVNSQSGVAPLLVSFDASGSTDPDGAIVSYEWDFGDGNTGTGISPTHTYQAEGEFTATLIVIDDSLSADTFQLAINVEPTISENPCNIPQNLALGKAASQSSTYGVGAASYAVDGNPIGSSPWSADLQHTQSELSPWWEVDLAESADLDSVRIYNRSNCCQNRLQNFYILVSELPFDPNSTLDELLVSPIVSATFFPGSRPDSISTLTLGERGRYLRIQLQSSGRNTSLHMAEVEVWGCVGETDILPIQFETATSDPECFEDLTGGSIAITSVSGGTPPYAYSIDGGCSFVSTTSFPGLSYGDYPVIVQDASGMQAQQLITLGVQTEEGEIKFIQQYSDSAGRTGDHFGYDLSLLEGEVMIGARFDEADSRTGNYNSGTVYVLEKDGDSWVPTDILEPSRVQENASFGYNIIRNKEWTVISSKEDNGAGAVYFFRKENGEWIEFQRVVGSNVVAGEAFGNELSLSGKTLAISTFTSKRTFIYAYNGSEWEEQAIIEIDGDVQGDVFASEVSLSGNRLLIGRRFDNSTGAAYLYEKTEEEWELTTTLRPVESGSGSLIGQKVGISGDWAFVSVSGDDESGNNSGAVYIFRYNQGGWEEVQKLTLDGTFPNAGFGNKILVKGDLAVIGANTINNATGAAFVYKRKGDLWQLISGLTMPSPEDGSSYGLALDFDGTDLWVGAFGKDVSGPDQGAVYAYEMTCSIPTGCEENPTNLALNQPASQSSTYGLGTASVAVDGDTDGTRGPWGSSPSIQHTNNEASPWWEVELAELSNISSVNFYNRTNCCSNRLKQFYVFVSETPFGDRSLEELLNDPTISQTYVEEPVGESFELELSATGKYLRIQLTGNGILHMAEVEVIGCPSDNNSAQRFSNVTDGLSQDLPTDLIKAYPNPFSQEIQVDLGENWDRTQVINVYNAVGQRIHTQPLGEIRMIDLGSNWPSGLYWLEVHSSESVQTLQVVKQ